jgi:glycosyltransferase involved in cell wall biosynthesis
MAISYGFLSTHPPTRCGLATFNSALATHLTTHGTPSGIVRVTEAGDDQRPGPGVVQTWRATTTAGWRDVVAALNAYDVAVVQHEYGIYPGKDGEDVLPLLRRLTTPSIVVLHTVLSNPTAEQKSLLEQIVAAADAVVTMTDTAHDRLLLGYRVDARKVGVIPHGVTDRPAPAQAVRKPGSHLLTWGLLGPGKGVEWVLRALTDLRDLDPVPTYTVAGRTHPKVAARDGEAYRTELYQLGARLGVAHMVNYRSGYQDPAELDQLIRSADVVVLPYDSREQVTSGVLTEAVAAGIPVVATTFPHAVELLTDGPGLLVPHRDPAALAGAVRRILTEPGLRGCLTARTSPLAADVRWPAVAARYDELAGRLVRAEATSVDAART